MKEGRVVINRKMVAKEGDWTREQCMEVEMSPKQREVFLIIDEFWSKYGYSPALRRWRYYVRQHPAPAGLQSCLIMLNPRR